MLLICDVGSISGHRGANPIDLPRSFSTYWCLFLGQPICRNALDPAPGTAENILRTTTVAVAAEPQLELVGQQKRLHCAGFAKGREVSLDAQCP